MLASSTRSAFRAVVAALVVCSLLVTPVPVQAGPATLDLTFNSTGFRSDNFAPGGIFSSRAVAVQPDGKIVTVGEADVTGSGSGKDFGVARYNADGTPDSTFGGGDGFVNTPIASGSNPDTAEAVAIQPDGRIVVAGYSQMGPTATGMDFSVVRYNADGSLDTSFDGDGKTTVAMGVGNTWDFAYAVALQADGKIVVAGEAESSTSNRDFALLRLNADGSLDASLDGDGRLTTAIGPGGNPDVAKAVALQADGKIVAAGSAELTLFNAEFAVVRYNTDGSLDTSFDGDGRVTTAIGPYSGTGTGQDAADAIAVQADGKIVAAGYANMGGATGYDFAAVRYNADGSLDTSFDADGRVTTAIGAGDANDQAFGMVVEADGKIVAAGRTIDGSATDLAIARYNTDGSPDVSFDTDGKATLDLGGNAYVSGIALYSFGRIVVAAEGLGVNNFLTARIWLSTVVTAAPVAVTGRVTDSRGRGVRGARLTLTDTAGAARHATTNSFGYYRFTDVPSGEGYMLRVEARNYTFADPVRYVQLSEDLAGVDFTAQRTAAAGSSQKASTPPAERSAPSAKPAPAKTSAPGKTKRKVPVVD